MKAKQVVKNGKKELLAIVALLTMLPSCGFVDWVKDKLGRGKSAQSAQPVKDETGISMPQDGSEVLVWIEGKPLITQKSLESEKQEVIAANPQLQAMIALMDAKQLDRNLTDGLTNRAIITKYVIDSGLDKKAEYQKEFKRMLQSVKDMLNTKYFSEAFPAKVSDAQVSDYYEKNKDAIPALLVSRGGVNAEGIAFTTEKEANDFLNKVKAAKGDIKKVAQDAGLGDKAKDFKLVHDQSLGLNDRLREKIVEIKKFPTIEMYRIDDDAFWVVSVSGKEEATYKPYNEVKEDLKQMLEKEKTMEQLEKELTRLKGVYKIKVNEEYFVSEGAPAPEEVQEPMKDQKKPAAKKSKVPAKGKKVADAERQNAPAPAQSV